MSPADLFSVVYVLMAEEAGGRAALEEQFAEWNQKEEEQRYLASKERFDPNVPLPKKLEESQRAVMAMGAPAPKKEASQ